MSLTCATAFGSNTRDAGRAPRERGNGSGAGGRASTLNFFADQGAASPHPEYEREKKAKEDRDAIPTVFLGQGSHERSTSQPFYMRAPDKNDHYDLDAFARATATGAAGNPTAASELQVPCLPHPRLCLPMYLMRLHVFVDVLITF